MYMRDNFHLRYTLAYYDEFKADVTKAILGLTAHGPIPQFALNSSSSLSGQNTTSLLDKLTIKDLAYIVVHGISDLSRKVGHAIQVEVKSVYLGVASLDYAFRKVGIEQGALVFPEYAVAVMRSILAENDIQTFGPDNTTYPFEARLAIRPKLDHLMDHFGRSRMTLWAYGRYLTLIFHIPQHDPLRMPGIDNPREKKSLASLVLWQPSPIFSKPTITHPSIDQCEAPFACVDPRLTYSPPPPVVQRRTRKRKEARDATDCCEPRVKRRRTVEAPRDEDEDIREDASHRDKLSSIPPPTSSPVEGVTSTRKRSRVSEDDSEYQPTPAKIRGPNDKSKSEAATTSTAPIITGTLAQILKLPTPKHPVIVGKGTCWPCPYPRCSKVCKNKTDAKRHLQVKNHQDPSFKCTGCGSLYTREDPAKRHLEATNRMCWKQTGSRGFEGPSGI